MTMTEGFEIKLVVIVNIIIILSLGCIAITDPIEKLASPNAYAPPGPCFHFNCHPLEPFYPRYSLAPFFPLASVMQVVGCDKARCTILKMPVEVLIEIASYLPKDWRWKPTSLARLARVCKLFSEICLDLLYRDVPIRVPHDTRCLTTLIHNVSRLQKTQSFYIDMYVYGGDLFFRPPF